MSEVMFSDDVLAGLVARGCKIECPVCGKRCFSEGRNEFRATGIGLHIKAKHPELYDDVLPAYERIMKDRKDREISEKEEKEARLKRKFIVSGEFLDEIVHELDMLISLMEPYYSQGNCDEPSRKMIERIEKMHEKAKARGES